MKVAYFNIISSFAQYMTKVIRHISCVFQNLSTAFAGNYKTSDKDLIELQRELYSEKDNTVKQDKINLNSDVVKVRHDFHRAMVDYKNQDSNGETTDVSEADTTRD